MRASPHPTRIATRARRGSGPSKPFFFECLTPWRTTLFPSSHTLHNVDGLRLERAVPIDADMIMTTDFILRTSPARLLRGSVFRVNHNRGIVIHEGSAKKIKQACLSMYYQSCLLLKIFSSSRPGSVPRFEFYLSGSMTIKKIAGSHHGGHWRRFYLATRERWGDLRWRGEQFHPTHPFARRTRPFYWRQFRFSTLVVIYSRRSSRLSPSSLRKTRSESLIAHSYNFFYLFFWFLYLEFAGVVVGFVGTSHQIHIPGAGSALFSSSDLHSSSCSLDLVGFSFTTSEWCVQVTSWRISLKSGKNRKFMYI